MSPEKVEVLVLGAGGLLGYPVLLEARRRHGDAAHGTFRTPRPALPEGPRLHRLELRQEDEVTRLLRRLRPAVVINCAGIVKSLCHDAHETITLNAALPHLLARTLAEWDGRLLQVSTDCVFSGRRGAYRESDTPDPVDLYGHSKLLGEVHEEPNLTARTSFIGFELGSRRGLLEWFLTQRGSVRGFRRALWSGLTADCLATVLVELAGRREVTGRLHVTGPAIDKYALLGLLAEVFEHRPESLEAVDEPVIDRSLHDGRLRRLGFEVPPLREQLLGLRRWRQEHLPAAEAAGGTA